MVRTNLYQRSFRSPLGCYTCAAPRSRGLGAVGVAPVARMVVGSADARARGAAAIAAAKSVYMKGGLRGLRGLGALGLSQTASGAAGGAATGAKVGSVVPGVGTAIGAVVGAVAGALFSKKKDPNAAEKEALKGNLDKYMQIQGTIPGRAMDLLTLKQLIDGAGYRGMWPNIKKWSGDAIAGAIDGCKGCTPPTIRDFVKQQVAAGDIDPVSLANKFTDLVNKTWGSKWFVATAGATQRQLIIDLMDFFISQNKPDAPLFYAPEWTQAAQQPVSAPSYPTSTGTPIPVQIPSPSTGGPTVSTPVTLPAGGVQTVTVPTSVTDPGLKAYIDAMLAQGKSSQDAFTAALSALSAQGVSPTPQVQAAVADQVKSAATAGAGMGASPLLIAGLIGLGLVFALARPASSRRSNA